MPTLTLTPSVARNLVHLLATDDAFRAQFATDTEAAILAAGHVPDNGESLSDFVEACCPDIVLADKEVIAQAEEEIVSMLTCGTAYAVPMLEYGNTGSRTLR